MRKVIIGIGLGLGIGLAQAGEGNIDTKTTATMRATCSISADTIGFGAVATPLMMQTAQSDMTVKCSNASAYTVDLKYGGIYGSGTGGNQGGNKAAYFTHTADNVGYYIYDTSGYKVGHIGCGYSGSLAGKTYFSNQQVANLYGASSFDSWQSSVSACVSNGQLTGTFPNGWSGAFNAPGFIPITVGNPGYPYGVMNGLSKGDKLAYSIQVPGEPTKVWNVGNNSYKSTGNGEEQSIPMIAKIVPDKSGSKYPAPDMYLDTVTAVISY